MPRQRAEQRAQRRAVFVVYEWLQKAELTAERIGMLGACLAELQYAADTNSRIRDPESARECLRFARPLVADLKRIFGEAQEYMPGPDETTAGPTIEIPY